MITVDPGWMWKPGSIPTVMGLGEGPTTGGKVFVWSLFGVSVVALLMVYGRKPTNLKGLGRRAADAQPWQFEPRELEHGCKVEMEHTSSRKRACEIAMDHLTEDHRYYTKLAKIHLD